MKQNKAGQNDKWRKTSNIRFNVFKRKNICFTFNNHLVVLFIFHFGLFGCPISNVEFFRHYASKLIKSSQLKRKKNPKEVGEECAGALSEADFISDFDASSAEANSLNNVGSTAGGADLDVEIVDEDGYFEDPNCDSDDCNSRPKKVTKGVVINDKTWMPGIVLNCMAFCCAQVSANHTICHLRPA